jgi:cardiolipin synthase
MLLTAFILILYAVGLASAINAAMTARTATGAVAWVVALTSFPLLAVPAYWVFGRSKFEGVADAYSANRERIDAIVEEMAANLEPLQVRLEGAVPYYDVIRKLSGNNLVRGNEVELLVNGEATFDSIIDGIARASEYVIVQSYIIRDDGLGQQLKQALLKRAQAGIQVFLLYDEVGCLGLPGAYGEELRSAGAKVSSFRPTRGVRNRFQLNFRNHRKIVIVDGESGWLGGHNVGDEYLGLNADLSPWRDTHVRLRGPAVIQLQGVVAADWYWATRELPPFNWQPETADRSDTRALIIPSGPTQPLETAGLIYVMALNQARRRIWLTAPYFVPDEAVMKALELAALRGVEIRILLAGATDSSLANHASYHFIPRLIKLGIRFTVYRPGFLHQKVTLLDEHTALVGTANFDNRSFRLNFEVTALVHDDAFAAEVETMLKADFAHGKELEADELDARGFLWRLKVSFARLLAPVL